MHIGNIKTKQVYVVGPRVVKKYNIYLFIHINNQLAKALQPKNTQ